MLTQGKTTDLEFASLEFLSLESVLSADSFCKSMILSISKALNLENLLEVTFEKSLEIVVAKMILRCANSVKLFASCTRC